MTVIARKMKMITSNVLVKFTGNRLYSGLSNLVNYKMEKESSNNLGLDFCVHTDHSISDMSGWHVINSTAHRNVYASPLPLGPDPPCGWYSAASSGSKVYLSGGYDFDRKVSTNQVFCMDTHNPEEGWKELPPMKHERSRHGSIFFGEKMYVWGRTLPPEVYDKNLNKWDSLARVPKEVALHAVECRCYLPHTDLGLNCEVVKKSKYSMACVGGMLYGLSHLRPGDLLACDPSDPTEVKPLANLSKLYKADNFGSPEHHLISLGDDILGVVWLDNEPGKMDPFVAPSLG